MSRDQIAKRITDLQTLHASLNNVLMEAKKMYVPAETGPGSTKVIGDGIPSMIETVMVAVKNDIDALRRDL